MITSFKLNKNIPYAIEECAFNIMDNKLICVCGFSMTLNGVDKIIDNFTNITSSYDLKTKKWKMLPPFPGDPRQGLKSVVIQNNLYCYGGFSYIINRKIKKQVQKKWQVKAGFRSYNDGYKLSYNKKKNKYVWTKLPDLPESITNFGIVAKNNYIYICGGASAIYKTGQLSTTFNNVGTNLHRLNLENLSWDKLESLPGTPRAYLSCFLYDKYIYCIGGLYPNSTWSYGSNESRFFTIIDNWKYDTILNKWDRISDNTYPISSWSSSGNILHDNKAIFIGSSYRKEGFINNKKTMMNNLKKVKIDCTNIKYIFESCDIILYYDIHKNTFVKSNVSLPFKINLPQYQIMNNVIHIVSGEVYGTSSAIRKKHQILKTNFYGPHLCTNISGTLISNSNSSNSSNNTNNTDNTDNTDNNNNDKIINISQNEYVDIIPQ